MSHWDRRSVITSSVAVAGLVGGVGITGADDDGDDTAENGTEDDGDDTDGDGDDESDTASNPVAETAGWSSVRGNAAGSAYSASDSFPEPTGVAWTHDATGDVAVSDGTLFLRTGADLQAIDVETGDLEWTVALEDEGVEPTGTPAVANGTVYLAGERLIALDAVTGDLEWTVAFETGDETTSPTVAYGTVYVVADGDCHAVDAETGDLEWERETVDVAVEDRSESPPETETRAYDFQPVTVAVADERVYALLDGEEFEAVGALDATTGEPLWTGMDRGTTFVGPISLTDDVFYARYDSPDLRFDPDESVREFRGIYEGISPASADEVTITGGRYTLSGDGWTHEPGWIDPFENLQIAGETGIVYFRNRPHDADDEIVGFDLDDGAMRWAIVDDAYDTFDLPETFVAGETGLYLQTDERLVAFRHGPEGGPGEDDGDDGDDGSGDDHDGGDDGSGDDHDGGDDDGAADADDSAWPGDGEELSDDSQADGDDETAAASGDDLPGFTTGVTALGGVLGLEWLRRQAPANESGE